MQGVPRSVAVVVFLVVLAVPSRAITDVEIMRSNGDTEVVLLDGRVLTVVSVERRDDLYVLELGGGALVTLPVALVSDARSGRGHPPQPVASTAADLEAPEGEVAQPPAAEEAAVAVLAPEPRPIDYAGSTSLPPSLTRQLGVLRGPSVTRRSETWQPTDSYGWAHDVTYFDSSRWNFSFDSRFTPSSAYEPSGPGPDFNGSSWHRPGGQSPRWRPQEGWAEAIWFPEAPTTP